jgi:hypothetical protein
MKTDPSRFAVGDEWVYRFREYEPSERVRILAVTLNKNTARLDVVFPDDPTQRVENIPGSRLRAPWSEAERYNTLMANWHRIIQPELSDVESFSASEVFSVLIPDDVATIASSQVSDATAIHDRARLEAITGVSMMELLADVEWFEHENAVMVSPAGTLRIAEAACLANPTPVLELIAAEQAESIRNSQSAAGHLHGTICQATRECAYHWRQRDDQPRHELLRQWCGRQAATTHDRLLAAEAENQRLDRLIYELIQALERVGERSLARRYAEEHRRVNPVHQDEEPEPPTGRI